MIRILDFSAALTGLLVAVPVIGLCMMIHRLTAKGSPIFAQPRVGRGEVIFTCYKLRTMAPGTPSLGTHEVGVAAVTPLGGFLRRFKLDELPQLWNVLKGEMSLVGPRPCLPGQTGVIEARRALGIYTVRPGVTGPAQVLGIDMSTPERLAAADAVWVANPTFLRYCRVLFATASGRGFGDRIKVLEPSDQ